METPGLRFGENHEARVDGELVMVLRPKSDERGTETRMPVDAEPVEGGRVVLTSGNRGPRARVLTNAELASPTYRGARLYTSHFQTCPQAGSWRRR